MEKLKLGIIGIGGMGTNHALSIIKGTVPEIQLTAVADIRDVRLSWARENLPGTVAIFEDGRNLIESGTCDAVLIATPHYFHPDYVIYALEHGLHAMSEKPAGVLRKRGQESKRARRRSSTSSPGYLRKRGK